MTLFIDTTQFDSVKFSLKNAVKSGSRVFATKKYKITPGNNHKTVALLDKFIRSQRISPVKIKKIAVATGPGSFNGIRVGLSMAQALGLAWQVPVSTIPANEIAKL